MLTSNLLSQFKETGYKLTKPRLEILGVLTTIPASAQEIQEILGQKKVKTDIVTIYRNLDLLIRIGLARKTQFGDKRTRYEFVTNQNHHHHLICENCGSVEDIPLNEKIIVKQVKKQTKFKVERHNLEFFGFCAKCQ